MLTGIVPGRLKKKADGTASLPEAGGHRIIVNLLSTSGEWPENDFCQDLERRWAAAKTEYRRGYYAQRYFKLGMIQEINIRSDLTVVNALVFEKDGEQDSLNKDAANQALTAVAELAKYNGSSVHFNKDESWEKIAELVEDAIIKKGVNVTLYGSED